MGSCFCKAGWRTGLELVGRRQAWICLAPDGAGTDWAFEGSRVSQGGELAERKNMIGGVFGGRPGVSAAAVLCVLAGAAVLRLWGVGYGLPFVFHPDENRQVLDSLGMAQRMSPLGQDFAYPAFHKYVLILVNGGYYVLGRLTGWFADPADFALKFLTGESHVFLVSRLASVAAGLATVWAVFVYASRVFSRTAGLLALVFSSAMFHLVQHSQWAIGDIFLAAFTTAALMYTTLAAVETDRPAHVTLALLFTGLAVSTKPQGVFLLVPFAASQVYALMDLKKDGKGKGRWADWAFVRARLPGAALLIAASVAGNLSWLFDFASAHRKFTMLSEVARLGISSMEPFTPGLVNLAGWFSWDLIRQEGPLGAVLLGGIAFAAARRTRQDVIFLSYAFVFFFVLRDWAIRYLHLFVALMPVLCVFGARAAADLMARARVRGAAAAALVAVAVLPSVVDSAEASLVKSRTDTRLEARRWIEKNVPAGTVFAMDWYEFAVPLWSSTPVYLLNPRSMEIYEKSVPERVKAGFDEFVSGRKSYGIVPVVFTTPGPNWPEGMPERAVEKARRGEVYRELYSVFNFRSLEELREMGVEYLVISSYGYTNFLLDTDPAKNERAVFNYLFKEDLLSFNRQADHYIEDGRFGLLYFLNKRARDFYVPLLRNTANAAPVAEFSPGPARPGPVIKIFRLQGSGMLFEG